MIGRLNWPSLAQGRNSPSDDVNIRLYTNWLISKLVVSLYQPLQQNTPEAIIGDLPNHSQELILTCTLFPPPQSNFRTLYPIMFLILLTEQSRDSQTILNNSPFKYFT